MALKLSDYSVTSKSELSMYRWTRVENYASPHTTPSLQSVYNTKKIGVM
jgi:hypothetical protein